MKEETKCYCGHTTYCDCGPKQETLEEAGEKLYPNRESFLYRFQNIERKAFTEGAKWQQEQYTVEEQHVGHTIDELDKEYIRGFNEGAKFQQERSYSEEEVNEIIAEAWNSCEDNEGETFTDARKRILEQFKNK